MPGACLCLDLVWLNFRFSLTLTFCESWDNFFVSSRCVNLIRLFICDDALRGLGIFGFSNNRVWGECLASMGVHFGSLMAWAVVPSKAVVLLLLIHCLMFFPLFVWVLFLVLVLLHITRCPFWLLYPKSCDCECSMALPHCVVGMGLQWILVSFLFSFLVAKEV